AAVALRGSPGYGGAIKFGQNAMISLAVRLLGWWVMARGRPVLGGMVWGVLAFKPVWGLAFGPALLLTRRWRAAVAMLLTGTALAALTLPVVGWGVWRDWLEVGKEATQTYKWSETWVFLSRDLVSIPRRWLTFPRRGAPEPALVTRLGLLLWLTPPALTAAVALRYPRRVEGGDGPGAAFVLLGAWLSCFHFMYYDSLLAALPVGLLFPRPGQYWALRFWPRSRAPLPAGLDLTALGPAALERFRPPPRESIAAHLLAYYRPTLGALEPPPAPLLPGGRVARWVRNPFAPTLLVLTLALCQLVPGLMQEEGKAPPLDTAAFLLLWAWCGWQGVRRGGGSEDDKTAP